MAQFGYEWRCHGLAVLFFLCGMMVAHLELSVIGRQTDSSAPVSPDPGVVARFAGDQRSVRWARRLLAFGRSGSNIDRITLS